MDKYKKPLRIAVNAVLAYEQPRGVGKYLNTLLPALAKIDEINEYYIYYGKWMSNYAFTKIHKDNFKLIELDIENSQVSRNLYLAIKLPSIVKRLGADVYWVPDSQATLFKPCRMISTIHDLAEFVVPEKYSKKTAMIRRAYVGHQVRLSDHIITVSEYSKCDICRRFGIHETKVTAIYNAIDENQNIAKTVEKPEKYFLFVSEIERAKNLNVLIEAYVNLGESVRNQFEIRVVGKKGNSYNDIVSKVKEYEIEDRVVFYGYLSNEELDKMYRHAYAFIFPSLFEGFGYPVLEAMSKGVPVICSNAGSIPEVGGNAVLTFDPCDSVRLAEHLNRLTQDDDLRRELIKDGLERSSRFTTSRMAEETLGVLLNEQIQYKIR